MSIIFQLWDSFYMITPRHPPSPIPPLPCRPRSRKVTANLNLTCKNIQSKTKKKAANKILPAAIGKRKQILSLLPSDYNLQSPLDVDAQISKHVFNRKGFVGVQYKKHSGRFRHIQTQSGIFRHIQELFRHILNSM